MVQLKLDVSALNALFPEGSTARVELERAVIASVTNRIGSKTLNAVVRNEIDRIQDMSNVRKEVQRLLGEYFDPKDRYSRELTLTPEQKKAVCTDVHNAYRELIRSMLIECADAYSEGTMFNDMRTRLMQQFDQKVLPYMLDELKKSTTTFGRALADIGLAEVQQLRQSKLEHDQKQENN